MPETSVDPKNRTSQPGKKDVLESAQPHRWASALVWVLVLALVLIAVRLIRGW